MGRGGGRKNILTVVAGDFNARIGRARDREEARVIGPHPLKGARSTPTSDIVEKNRELFMTWAKHMSMCVANSMFDLPPDQTMTYKLLGGGPGRALTGRRTNTNGFHYGECKFQVGSPERRVRHELAPGH